jgi:Tol biopolymer transport system component
LSFVHYVFKADEEQSTIKTAVKNLIKIRPILKQTGIQDFPDISSDGRLLVYTSWQTVMPYRGAVSVVQQIWTLDLIRGKAGQLLLSNSSDIHPRWSPDGKKLVFSSNRTGRYEIWTASVDGGDLRRVTRGPGEKTWPVWSPDGSRILFTHTQQGRIGLSLVDNAGGPISPYTPFGADAGVQLKDADWRSVAD